MADVFISYSQLDQERVQPIAARLSSLGYVVSYQHAAQSRIDEIEREFDAAPAVLTVWSENARNSAWVLAQSARALDEAKLLQMQIDPARIPSPFDALPVANMSGGKSEWGTLENALARLMREGRAPKAIDRLAGWGGFPLAGAPRLLLVASTTSMVAFFAALTAAFNGAMTPDQLRLILLGVLAVGGLCTALAAHRLFVTHRAGG